MVKVYPNEISLIGLAQIASNRMFRTGTTPFGMPPGMVVRYVGRAVPWKGLKGDAFWRWAEKEKPELARGLRKAIDISKKNAEIYGVALVQLMDGRQMVVPRKVAAQMAGKGITIISELAYDRPAGRTKRVPYSESVRGKYGIKGEYKALVGAPVGAIAVMAPR